MNDQGKGLTFHLIELMFSDSQANKIVGKKWRIILQVAKCFSEDFFYQRNFMPTFFLPIR